MSRIAAIMAGLVVILALSGGFIYLQQDKHMVLDMKISKVRVQKTTEEETLMIIDFHAKNASSQTYQVRAKEVELEDKQGRIAEAIVANEGDVNAAFQYYAELGPKYNPAMHIGMKIPPKSEGDFMLALMFRLPENIVRQRAKLTARIKEKAGLISEMVETR